MNNSQSHHICLRKYYSIINYPSVMCTLFFFFTLTIHPRSKPLQLVNYYSIGFLVIAYRQIIIIISIWCICTMIDLLHRSNNKNTIGEHAAAYCLGGRKYTQIQRSIDCWLNQNITSIKWRLECKKQFKMIILQYIINWKSSIICSAKETIRKRRSMIIIIIYDSTIMTTTLKSKAKNQRRRRMFNRK